MRAAATRRRTTSKTVNEEWRNGYRLMMEQSSMEPARAAKCDNAQEPQYAPSCSRIEDERGHKRMRGGWAAESITSAFDCSLRSNLLTFKAQ